MNFNFSSRFSFLGKYEHDFGRVKIIVISEDNEYT